MCARVVSIVTRPVFRWEGRSSVRPCRPTSKNALTFRARCLDPTADLWPMHRTCPCIWVLCKCVIMPLVAGARLCALSRCTGGRQVSAGHAGRCVARGRGHHVEPPVGWRIALAGYYGHHSGVFRWEACVLRRKPWASRRHWRHIAWCGRASHSYVLAMDGARRAHVGSMPPFSRTLAEEGACFKSFKIVVNGVFQVGHSCCCVCVCAVPAAEARDVYRRPLCVRC